MAFTPSHKWTVVRLLAWPLAVLAAEKSPSPPAELPALIPPQPALVAYAATHGIPLDGLDASPGPAAATPGDSVTALVTLREGQTGKQWLVHLEIATPTEKERAENSPIVPVIGVNGHNYKFSAGAPLALDIRTAGPFIAGVQPRRIEKKRGP